METTLTSPRELTLLAALAITGTVFLLSSDAEAKRKAPPGVAWQLNTPQIPGEPIVCPMCVRKLQPGATKINPRLFGRGKFDPQPEPWTPALKNR
jgi:hypothetical protein